MILSEFSTNLLGPGGVDCCMATKCKSDLFCRFWRGYNHICRAGRGRMTAASGADPGHMDVYLSGRAGAEPDGAPAAVCALLSLQLCGGLCIRRAAGPALPVQNRSRTGPAPRRGSGITASAHIRFCACPASIHFRGTGALPVHRGRTRKIKKQVALQLFKCCRLHHTNA